MESIVEFIKLYLVPGSLSFLLAGLILGISLILLRGPASRWGKGILISLAVGYLLLSLPITAVTLETILSGDTSPLQGKEDLGEIQAIVILGGGGTTYEYEGYRVETMSEATSLRVLEGVRLYHLLGPLPIFVSGGAAPASGKLTPESKVMAETLLNFGVDEEHIFQEPLAGNTYEQGVILGEILMDEGIEAFLLVTSPTHMRRSLSTFEAQGLSPIAAVTSQHTSYHPVMSQKHLLPSNEALDASRMALRELMALLYYKMSGRLSVE